MQFTPTLLWSQTYENIEIEINLPNISNEILKTENNIFHSLFSVTHVMFFISLLLICPLKCLKQEIAFCH